VLVFYGLSTPLAEPYAARTYDFAKRVSQCKPYGFAKRVSQCKPYNSAPVLRVPGTGRWSDRTYGLCTVQSEQGYRVLIGWLWASPSCHERCGWVLVCLHCRTAQGGCGCAI